MLPIMIEIISTSPRAQFWLAYLFDYYLRIADKVEKNTPSFFRKTVVPFIRHFSKAVYCFANGLLIEPFGMPWTHFIDLKTVNYNDDDDDNYIEDYCETTAFSSYYTMPSFPEEYFNVRKCFVYAKQNDGKIICRRMELPVFVNPKTQTTYYNVDLDSLEMQSITKRLFISVTYIDPEESTNTIVIVISPELYNVGNEILSKEFVARYIRYNYASILQFSKNYRLQIMDNDLNYLELRSKQAILLTTEGYRVIQTD